MNKKKKTEDALTILHRRYYAGKPERLAALAVARANDSVARKIAAGGSPRRGRGFLMEGRKAS